MDNTDFITILAWMRHLRASLVEKMVFAIIYGFSKDRHSDFRGSRQYLAEWCECSTKTIDRALAKLCEAGYIIKREEVVKDVKFCRYTVNFDTLDKMSIPWTKCPEGSAILSKTEDKMSHNNIENNIVNNIVDTTRACARDTARKKFDFKAALISAGISESYTDRLIAIRKSKRLTNSEKAFNDLNTAITTICNTYGVVPDEVVKFCVDRNWGAIRSDWDGVEHIKANIRRRGVSISIDDLINKEMAQLR